MARDEGLEEILRETLADVVDPSDLNEKTMFGGRVWLLRGNLLCGARLGGMLVRLGRGEDAWALARPDIGPMMSGARRMQGWVWAGPDAYGDDALRHRLLAAAFAFVGRLPPKA